MPRPKKKTTGPASFCIPRAALDALLAHQASAYEICTYLTLACFTDPTGRYSAASVHAVNTYTGANKTRGGPVAKALERLKTIRASRPAPVRPDAGRGRRSKFPAPPEDLGPILFDRAGWLVESGEDLPEGPTPHSTVRYVLPDFGELLADRVWFGSNLVRGVGEFDRPLKALKNAGDEAARLLLLLYSAHDLELWGGVDPHKGPSAYYVPVGDGPVPGRTYSTPLRGGAQMLHWTRGGSVLSQGAAARVWPHRSGTDYWKAHDAAGGPAWRALEALEALGLIYEVVLVLNRRGVYGKFQSGSEYYDIPADAEPLYELDVHTRHGWKPTGEEGLAAATRATANAWQGFQIPASAKLTTYAALVSAAYGAMIAGIYRLRFRLSNPKNAGVSSAWARIHQGNRDGFALIQSVRAVYGLPELSAPVHTPAEDVPKPAKRGRKTTVNRPKKTDSAGRTLQ